MATGTVSATVGFVSGGLAGCVAATFTNAADVAKTRMQLQGELANAEQKVYRNVFDALSKTWRNEGIRGVQRGLGPAYLYQIGLNGCRIGFYEPFRRGCNELLGRNPTQQIALTSITAGALSAIVGSFVGNPFFLVKARMQAYSPVLPVGAQHYYKNAFHAFSTIIMEEGYTGLLRGANAAMFRGAIGGTVQIPSYVWIKSQIVKHNLGGPDSAGTFLASSAISGAALCLAWQPADTTLTRMYNQPTIRRPDGRVVGALYKNPLDCLWKTLKAEGVAGWYKGTTAHFLRIAPQTVISLTANDLFIRIYLRARHGEDA